MYGKNSISFPPPALSGSGSMGVISAFSAPLHYDGENKVFFIKNSALLIIYLVFSTTPFYTLEYQWPLQFGT